MTQLQDVLDRHTVEGALYERLPHDQVRCYACGHACLIKAGRQGVCKVRFNRDGRLYVPRGYVGALQCDPIEKKPFFHVWPGSVALSFGMLGCDYHCPYCQNWLTSQTLRDPASVSTPRLVEPAALVDLATQAGARVLASTYNEPLITSEWAVEVFRAAKERRLGTAYISNGNATPQVLAYLRPWVDYYKVDLKGFSESQYRRLGGVLDVVKDSIRMLHQQKFWVEVVTLLIPGFNDTESEIRQLTEFLASVSREIPWHVTAFHQDYKMREPSNTQAAQLVKAAGWGREAGLHYVYAGNLPGQVGLNEHTCCPGCGNELIRRLGFKVLSNRLVDGLCPDCGHQIPGHWITH